MKQGIDDLLKAHPGEEIHMIADLKRAIVAGDSETSLFRTWNISDFTEDQLRKVWFLDDERQFANHHRQRLQGLFKFTINGIEWKFDKTGQCVLVHDITPDEYFFYTTEKERGGYTYHFYRPGFYLFLQNRGFFQYEKVNGQFEWIHITGPIVRTVEPIHVRQFVNRFTKSLNNLELLDMIYRGSKIYYSADTLLNLNTKVPDFIQPAADSQNLYLGNSVWRITQDEIKEFPIEQLGGHVWKDKIRDVYVTMRPDLFLFERSPEGGIAIRFPDLNFSGCQFMRFVWNTGNFTGEKNNLELNEDQYKETLQHFASKVSALGYLIHGYSNPSQSKAVVCMDGKLRDIGESNGRSGKSLFALALSQLSVVLKVNGKKRQLFDDAFVWERMTEKTETVFIDDLLSSFPFEQLLSLITLEWEVNAKNMKKFVMPRTPKVILTTNHIIKGQDPSFLARQFRIVFSDYYNQYYSPADEFGLNFFVDWDHEQWSLFYSFMAKCLQFYLACGFIEAPQKDIQLRNLQYEMGESFMTWADGYYNPEDVLAGNLNRDISKTTLFESFLAFLQPGERKFEKITGFKKKLKNYCAYKNYQFNPKGNDGPGTDLKKSGVEYIHISNT